LWGWMGTGTILKLVAGIGVEMGISVPRTVGDGYKINLSPCSSLISILDVILDTQLMPNLLAAIRK